MDNDVRAEFDILLTTRLTPPPLRGELVARPNLVARLEQARHYTLTLLSTPAGFGKTFLLGEWFSTTSLPVAWLSLDKADDEFTSFWRYCIAALQTRYPQVGHAAQGLLQAPQRLSDSSILVSLLNDLSELTSELVLVLDDYHLLTSDAIHSSVSFLLEHLPPHLHLVIAGRVDPPLPLTRLRARGALLELRAQDLRFTTEETTIFLREVMSLPLTEEDALVLTEKAEGWVAGLQLAALSLQRQPQNDLSTLVRLFGGRDRYILEYLLSEVLQQQSAEIQDFLLKSSLLSRLSASLCVAVTGYTNAQAVLEEVERANLFLLPLDNECRWYRYHALFADLLRHRLELVAASDLPILHRRAAAWYEQHSLFSEAMGHLLALPDEENNTHAANLIVDLAEPMVLRGDASLLLAWLKQLPEQWIRTRPMLAFAAALALLAQSRFYEVEAYLRLAEGLTLESEDEAAHWRGRLAALRSTVIVNTSREAHEAIEQSRQALALLSTHDPVGRGIAALNLGDALYFQGEFVSAQEVFVEAAEYNLEAKNYFVASITLASLGDLYSLQGGLCQAEQQFRLALRYASHSGHVLPTAGKAHSFLADILLEWNDVEAALKHAREGLRLCEQWGHTRHICDSYLSLAKALHVQGQREQAFAVLDEARTLVLKAREDVQLARHPTLDLDLLIEQVDVTRQRLLLWQGASESIAPMPHSPSYLLQLARQELRARVLIARGQTDETLHLLRHLLRDARSKQLGRHCLVFLCLNALAYAARGDQQEALVYLAEALRQAQPEGYIRTFVELGPSLCPLLRALSSRKDIGTYATRLLDAFPPVEISSGMPPTPSRLVEPLRKRELTILRLLSAGLSNREIAAQLVLTLGTVKWYVNAIYSKLGVRSRTQAVVRARELDLLS